MTLHPKWIRWWLAASVLSVVGFLLVNGLYAMGLLSQSTFLWGAGLFAGGVGLLAVSTSDDDFGLDNPKR